MSARTHALTAAFDVLERRAAIQNPDRGVPSGFRIGEKPQSETFAIWGSLGTHRGTELEMRDPPREWREAHAGVIDALFPLVPLDLLLLRGNVRRSFPDFQSLHDTLGDALEVASEKSGFDLKSWICVHTAMEIGPKGPRVALESSAFGYLFRQLPKPNASWLRDECHSACVRTARSAPEWFSGSEGTGVLDLRLPRGSRHEALEASIRLEDLRAAERPRVLDGEPAWI